MLSRPRRDPPLTRAERIDRLTLLVIQPLAAVFTLAALAQAPGQGFGWPVWLASVTIAVITVEYLETVWSYARPHAAGRRRLLALQLILSGLLMMLAFAAVYKQLGVLDALDRDIEYGTGIALYFAVITTATVGYGDYVPTPAGQPFAAVQSLLSLVWTGLFFGVVVSSLWSGATATPSDDSRS